MVMNGSHFENALSVGQFEIAYLDYIAHRFAHINDADREKQQRAFYREAETCNYAAQKQRTRIAHHNLRGIVIPNKESENAAQKSA